MGRFLMKSELIIKTALKPKKEVNNKTSQSQQVQRKREGTLSFPISNRRTGRSVRRKLTEKTIIKALHFNVAQVWIQWKQNLSTVLLCAPIRLCLKYLKYACVKS